MDRDVFVSCFAAVALAFLVFYVALQFTTGLISSVILVLLAVILVLVVSDRSALSFGRTRSRRR